MYFYGIKELPKNNVVSAMKTPTKSKTGKKNQDELFFESEKSQKISKSKKPRFDDDDDDEMEFENFEDFIELDDFDEDDY